MFTDFSTFASRISGVRSIRNELRIVISLTVVGFVLQFWMTLGEFMFLRVVLYPGTITRFFVMRCAFQWTMWYAVLGVCIWETLYVWRHYSMAEWGASIHTLDSFDSGAGNADDEDWAKTGGSMFMRGGAARYRDPYLTPYQEPYTAPSSSKGYDMPPDAPQDEQNEPRYMAASRNLPRSVPGRPLPPSLTGPPLWKEKLARGDFLLGPDVPSSSGGKYGFQMGGSSSEKFDYPEKVPLTSPDAVGESSYSARRGKWVPQDRHPNRKVLVEESFGAVLARTRSM